VVSSASVFSVHLVDEGDDGNIPKAAHLKQLARARLDALGGIDHHDGGIDRGQRAIGIFGKILVAGRVQKVEYEPIEFERHHRSHDRDAPLAFDLHPVGTGIAPLALGLDLTRQIDRAAKQQKLFGQRGLAGVGVGDDRKGTPARHLGGERRRGISTERKIGHKAKRLAGKPGGIKKDTRIHSYRDDLDQLQPGTPTTNAGTNGQFHPQCRAGTSARRPRK
jgi:hypothetical protein